MRAVSRGAFRKIVIGSALLTLASLAASPAAALETVRVGSKKFTESLILGELLTQAARDASIQAEHRAGLNSTRAAWEKLLRGDIDLYPDYTGTVAEELLGGAVDEESLRTALRARGIEMSRSLGFDDNYALGMREARADELSVHDISDLRAHPSLRLGLSDEFFRRRDGWLGLAARYALPQADVRPLDHDGAYRALQSGVVDIIDLYSTDVEIRSLGLRVLRDDRNYFPFFHAVVLYRADLTMRAPAMVQVIHRFEGRISTDLMIRMNTRVRVDHVAEAAVAAEFLGHAPAPGRRGQGLLSRALEHMRLVGVLMLLVVMIGILLGVMVRRRRPPRSR